MQALMMNKRETNSNTIASEHSLYKMLEAHC